MDVAPLDQLEKCREPDDRHLGGRSVRWYGMGFLLQRSGSVGASGRQRPGAARSEARYANLKGIVLCSGDSLSSSAKWRPAEPEESGSARPREPAIAGGTAD